MELNFLWTEQMKPASIQCNAGEQNYESNVLIFSSSKQSKITLKSSRTVPTFEFEMWVSMGTSHVIKHWKTLQFIHITQSWNVLILEGSHLGKETCWFNMLLVAGHLAKLSAAVLSADILMLY